MSAGLIEETIVFHRPTWHDHAAVLVANEMGHVAENTCSFVNLLQLSDKYGTEIAFFHEGLLRRYTRGYPIGGYSFSGIAAEDIVSCLQMLARHAKAADIPLRLVLLNAEMRMAVEQAFPDVFTFQENRAYAEYLYLREDHASFRGGRFQAKRNHVNGFRAMYPDATIEPLIAERITEARAIEQAWYEDHCRMCPADYESVTRERAHIEDGLEHLAEYGFRGVLLMVGGRAIGMSMAAPISSDVWDIHFEKVIPGYPAAWSVLVQAMAKILGTGTYLNREEDLGMEGLRKSKLSYRPCRLIEKFDAEPIAPERILC